jgi:hypothetical protein
MGECMCRSTFSWPQHQLEVSGLSFPCRFVTEERAPGTHWLVPSAGLGHMTLPGLELQPLGRAARGQPLYRIVELNKKTCTCIYQFKFSPINSLEQTSWTFNSHSVLLCNPAVSQELLSFGPTLNHVTSHPRTRYSSYSKPLQSKLQLTSVLCEIQVVNSHDAFQIIFACIYDYQAFMLNGPLMWSSSQSFLL